MVGKDDLTAIRRASESLSPDDTVVEFGPWLGAMSVVLAKNAKLHVIDNFVWTKTHDKRVPNVAEVGESFRPAFERNLEKIGVTATIHESIFRDFTWTGPKIDFCVIDAPKTANDLLTCLSVVI